MKQWNAVDWVVFTLASCVALILVAALAKMMFTKRNLTDDVVTIVMAVIASVISIIALYVGARMNKTDNDNKNE